MYLQDTGCQEAKLGWQLSASTFGTMVVSALGQWLLVSTFGTMVVTKHIWDNGCQQALLGQWLSASRVRTTVGSKHFWDKGCQQALLGLWLSESTFGTGVVSKHFWDSGCWHLLTNWLIEVKEVRVDLPDAFFPATYVQCAMLQCWPTSLIESCRVGSHTMQASHPVYRQHWSTVVKIIMLHSQHR